MRILTILALIAAFLAASAMVGGGYRRVLKPIIDWFFTLPGGAVRVPQLLLQLLVSRLPSWRRPLWARVVQEFVPDTGDMADEGDEERLEAALASDLKGRWLTTLYADLLAFAVIATADAVFFAVRFLPLFTGRQSDASGDAVNAFATFGFLVAMLVLAIAAFRRDEGKLPAWLVRSGLGSGLVFVVLFAIGSTMQARGGEMPGWFEAVVLTAFFVTLLVAAIVAGHRLWAIIGAVCIAVLVALEGVLRLLEAALGLIFGVIDAIRHVVLFLVRLVAAPGSSVWNWLLSLPLGAKLRLRPARPSTAGARPLAPAP